MDKDEPALTPDDLRAHVGRHAAFEALVWALARTHPDAPALVAAFKENAEIVKGHLVFLPLSEAYLDAFHAAQKQILQRMGEKE